MAATRSAPASCISKHSTTRHKAQSVHIHGNLLIFMHASAMPTTLPLKYRISPQFNGQSAAVIGMRADGATLVILGVTVGEDVLQHQPIGLA